MSAEEPDPVRVVGIAWQDTTGRLLQLSDGTLRPQERRGKHWESRLPVNVGAAIRDRAVLSLLAQLGGRNA